MGILRNQLVEFDNTHFLPSQMVSTHQRTIAILSNRSFCQVRGISKYKNFCQNLNTLITQEPCICVSHNISPFHQPGFFSSSVVTVRTVRGFLMEGGVPCLTTLRAVDVENPWHIWNPIHEPKFWQHAFWQSMLQSQLSKTLVGCNGHPCLQVFSLRSIPPEKRKNTQTCPSQDFCYKSLESKGCTGKTSLTACWSIHGSEHQTFCNLPTSVRSRRHTVLTQWWRKSRRQILGRKRLPNMSLDEDTLKKQQTHTNTDDKMLQDCNIKQKNAHVHGFTAIMQVHVSSLFEAISCHAFLWRAPTRQNWASKSSPCKLRIEPTFLG